VVINLFWGQCYFTWRQKHIVSKILSYVVLCFVIMEKVLMNIIDKTCVNSYQKFMWFSEEIHVTFLVEETFFGSAPESTPRQFNYSLEGDNMFLQNVRTFNCYTVYKLNRRPSFGSYMNHICSLLQSGVTVLI